MNISPESSDAAGNPRFATTSWSMIVSAGGSGSGSRMALEQLCQEYWYPLYAWLRSKQHSHESAEDMTQGFFARLLERDRIQFADPQRGRFRTFLLASLEHYVIGQWRKETAEKRGGKVTTLSLDFETADARYRGEPADSRTPGHLFDRAWALTILQQTMARLGTDYENGGKGRLFGALRGHLVNQPEASFGQIAQELSMSEGAVRVAAHRLRQRYRQKLREIVAQTVDDPNQVDEELTVLLAALGS